MHYRLNEPDVIQETVDGETLIVHTRNGSYYTLQGSGTGVWNALLAGRSVEQIEKSYDAGGDARRAFVRAALGQFIDALVEQHLILPTNQPQAPAEPSRDAESITKPAFIAPELRKFTDMQELLLADPIHEVDPEAGWPSLKDPGRTE